MTVHIWKEDRPVRRSRHAPRRDEQRHDPQEARQALDEAVPRLSSSPRRIWGRSTKCSKRVATSGRGTDWVCPAFVAVERHELALAV